VEGL
jgi:hypothetical protein